MQKPPKLPLFSRGLKNLVNTPMCKTCMSPPPWFLPALFETKQQLTGTGRVSAMLCSPVSLQVVQCMQSTPYGRLLFIDPGCSLESAERTSTQVTRRANRKKRLTVLYIVEHPNQEGDTCIDWTSQYCWTNGWNCLWRGHSVYRNRPLIPSGASFPEPKDRQMYGLPTAKVQPDPSFHGQKDVVGRSPLFANPLVVVGNSVRNWLAEKPASAVYGDVVTWVSPACTPQTDRQKMPDGKFRHQRQRRMMNERMNEKENH